MFNVIEFDFATKNERTIQAIDVNPNCASSVYYWLFLDWDGLSKLIPVLSRFCPDSQIDASYFRQELSGLVDTKPDFIGFMLQETEFKDGHLAQDPLRVILGERFIVTVFEEKSRVIDQVLANYRHDFLEFSRSPGFLLFEIVDFHSGNLQATFRQFEEEISKLQERLLTKVDDEIFFRVASATKQLLSFRFLLISTREVINAITMRKSPYISETTQPFLERKVGLLTRLSDDVSTQREVMSDTLNLYMGFVSYQTNKVINRLTIISVIFLPLTFLVGVYGMNFEYMPELGWKLGYPVFWLVVGIIVISLLLFFRKKKWLQT